jgi:lysophospholipase L1-like esterase
MGPSGAAPAIACPAAQSVQAPTGSPIPVMYPPPNVTGGTAPVTTTCAPPSGSTFPVGATNVSCTARDADQRASSCTFAVTVTRPPQLSATKFVAFGDSITSGKLATDCPFGGGASGCRAQVLGERPGRWFDDLLTFTPRFGEESAAAYPRALQSMLASRYVTQSFTVANEGNSGELVADGKTRLTQSLNANLPEVLLLQEGANDMTGGHPPIEAIVNDFRAMIRDARGRGVRVFLGTLLPQREGACRAYDYCDGVNDVVTLNARLRTLAASEGAVLVDLHQGFEGQTGTLLGLDGLHPNEAGYQKMADLFFSAVTEALEVR